MEVSEIIVDGFCNSIKELLYIGVQEFVHWSAYILFSFYSVKFHDMNNTKSCLDSLCFWLLKKRSRSSFFRSNSTFSIYEYI